MHNFVGKSVFSIIVLNFVAKMFYDKSYIAKQCRMIAIIVNPDHPSLILVCTVCLDLSI